MCYTEANISAWIKSESFRERKGVRVRPDINCINCHYCMLHNNSSENSRKSNYQR